MAVEAVDRPRVTNNAIQKVFKPKPDQSHKPANCIDGLVCIKNANLPTPTDAGVPGWRFDPNIRDFVPIAVEAKPIEPAFHKDPKLKWANFTRKGGE